MTFAAGLATEGFKPFCAIYSTFLQRAYDQVVHDVAIQKLPVRFAIDRAGLVGADGPTHAGAFDVAYLGCLPGFVRDGGGRRGRARAHGRDRGRDRRPAVGAPLSARRGRRRRRCRRTACRSRSARAASCAKARKVALLSFGTRLGECLKAADELAARGLSTTVADARFAKPLDADLVLRLAREHEVLITIEEGAVGGFGAHVLQALAEHGALDRGLKVRAMMLPDVFLDHDKPEAMYAQRRPRRRGHRGEGVRGARQGCRGGDGQAGVND